MKALKNPTPINVRPDAIALNPPMVIRQVASDFDVKWDCGLFTCGVDLGGSSRTIIYKQNIMAEDVEWESILAERFSWMNFAENKRRWKAAEDDPGEFYIRNWKYTDQAIENTARRIKDILEEHKDWKIVSNIC